MASSRFKVTPLVPRLDGHFGRCAALAAAGVGGAIVGSQQADAAIVYSGIVNINIPGNVDGVYLVVDTGVTGLTGGTTPGWDINPYFGANSLYNAAPGYGGVATGTNATNMIVGTMIDGTNATNTTILSGSLFPTSGPPGGYYGFRFTNGAAQIRYGWAQIIRGATGSTAGTIRDYAYENTGAGIPAGVPEPASFGLLAMGAAGLFLRRRS